jgi:uncharacterized protein
MKWQGRTSTNVEDRRGSAIKGIIGCGLGGGFLVIAILLLVTFCCEGDLSQVLNNSQFFNSAVNATYLETQQEKGMSQFVSVVLAETEDDRTEIFNTNNIT